VNGAWAIGNHVDLYLSRTLCLFCDEPGINEIAQSFGKYLLDQIGHQLAQFGISTRTLPEEAEDASFSFSAEYVQSEFRRTPKHLGESYADGPNQESLSHTKWCVEC
jgi:hypothetical protein